MQGLVEWMSEGMVEQGGKWRMQGLVESMSEGMVEQGCWNKDGGTRMVNQGTGCISDINKERREKNP